MKRINRNWEGLHYKLDDENTYKQDNTIHEKAKAQRKLIEQRKQELQAEIDQLSELFYEYENIELEAKRGAEETRYRLELMGYPLDANKRQTERAYYEEKELECYAGQREVRDGFIGKIIVPHLSLNTYRRVDGKKVKRTLIETCQYLIDFGS